MISHRARRRLRAHLALLAMVVTVCIAFGWLVPRADLRSWLSLSTAYAALGLLSATLMIGPWRILTGRTLPTSFDLRRDIGIWAGLVGLVHTAVGLTVHLRGRPWEYFLATLDPPTARWDRFGFANHTGLIAALLLLGLLALSNDASLRKLGVPRWKGLQRWTYAAFALMATHGVLYQLIEKRSLTGWMALTVLVGATLVLQVAATLQRSRQQRGS